MILRPVAEGLEISVRAQPRARTTEVAGPYGDRAIRIRLSAPPIDGAANEELVEFLADLFGLAPSNVELIRGHGSRDKVVQIHGASERTARERLGL